MKRYLIMLWYWLVNKNSMRRIVNPQGHVVVSLTSYDPRITRVFATIESIAAGNLKPKRLILWLDNSFKDKTIPSTLKRLESRGLEILFCEDEGPHKKYRPYVLSELGHDVPLVTADDDVLYPRQWLDSLFAAYGKNPERVYCHRARVVQFEPTQPSTQIWFESLPSAYRTWPPCNSTEASTRNFSIGVSGVLYPPSFLNRLARVSANELFKEVTPQADDIWLNFWGSYWGYEKQQLTPHAAEFTQIPLSGRSALHRRNVNQGGNDTQVQAMLRHLQSLSTAPKSLL
jgi:hypothetical protein